VSQIGHSCQGLNSYLAVPELRQQILMSYMLLF